VVCPRPGLLDIARRLPRFIKSATHPEVKTAKSPVSLCPRSVLPSLGRRCPPPPGDVTPRSLLLRTHAPNPSGSPLLRFFTSFPESLPVAPSPCCQRVLPDSILQISPLMTGPLPHGPIECSYLSLPRCQQPSPRHYGSAARSFRERDFPRASFRGCRHFVMFRPLRLRRLPDGSYRCEFPHRAAETFTSGHIVLCYLRTLRICYPYDTGN